MLFSGGTDSPFSYKLTLHDANIGTAGMLISAASLKSNESFIFTAIAETDGAIRVISGAGNDSIAGGAMNDHLQGRAGDDQLYGMGGNDVLIGGAGTDLLRGGRGVDTFRFENASDSRVGAGDTIIDFSKGEKIDLSAIDANSKVDGNQAFTFIGTGAFSGAGQLRAQFDAVAGRWTVSGDIDGDGNADFEIHVFRNDVLPMATADFVL
jgi:Ca2+-binding RTX toxin-like protein